MPKIKPAPPSLNNTDGQVQSSTTATLPTPPALPGSTLSEPPLPAPQNPQDETRAETAESEPAPVPATSTPPTPTTVPPEEEPLDPEASLAEAPPRPTKPPDWLLLASSALGQSIDGVDVSTDALPASPPSPSPKSPPYAPPPPVTRQTPLCEEDLTTNVVRRETTAPSESVEDLRARLRAARQEVETLESKVRTMLPSRRSNERLAIGVMRNVTSQRREQAMTKNPHIPRSRLPVLLEQLKRDYHRTAWTR